MTDPAIEAARRARYSPHYPDLPVPMWNEIAAAREALKPVRELHCKCLNGVGDWVCAECSWRDVLNIHWPCDTAKLIYSDEDLEKLKGMIA